MQLTTKRIWRWQTQISFTSSSILVISAISYHMSYSLRAIHLVQIVKSYWKSFFFHPYTLTYKVVYLQNHAPTLSMWVAKLQIKLSKIWSRTRIVHAIPHTNVLQKFHQRPKKRHSGLLLHLILATTIHYSHIPNNTSSIQIALQFSSQKNAYRIEMFQPLMKTSKVQPSFFQVLAP